jgi:hypothetical protein
VINRKSLERLVKKLKKALDDVKSKTARPSTSKARSKGRAPAHFVPTIFLRAEAW